MGFFRGVGRFFWRFMVIFSFIVNIILVIVLLVLGVLIFEIKNEVAQPLVNGLHSSFVGLDQATIDWTIPVRDEIQVVLDIPLKTDTVVVLNEPVPLQVDALIDLPGINAYNVNAVVDLELPQGLALPVVLDLDVAVNQPLPVELDVRAVIPLQETQLHDVAENLRLLFEPLARGLVALPSDFGEAGEMVRHILDGERPNLLAENNYSRDPWPGYSITAGLGYELYEQSIPAENTLVETGIVPLGGIRFMDQEIRPEIYDAGGPVEINKQAKSDLESRNVPDMFYNGRIGDYIANIATTASPQVNTSTDNAVGGPNSPPQQDSDLGILPTPSEDEGPITETGN